MCRESYFSEEFSDHRYVIKHLILLPSIFLPHSVSPPAPLTSTSKPSRAAELLHETKRHISLQK